MSSPGIAIDALRALAWQLLVLTALLACALTAHAESTSLKTLLMPGKLVQGHARFEGDCNKCHVSFAKQAQDRLCLDCHKKIAADIAAASGYHGRIAPGGTPACKQCHTDHKGRDADITGLDRDTFNHDRTDFHLDGRHADLACDSCHKPGKQFRDAPAACVGCHRANDVHRGALGEQCSSCHTAAGWRQTHFDHAKTGFTLRGAHREVSCASCHPSQRYKETPQACVGCHAINDVHNGRNGSQCQRCHNENTWKKVSFDHNRDTRFPLHGAHADAACNSCHKQGKFDVKLGTACLDCHRGDDIHKGRNGSECQRCHSESSWRHSTFDHDRDTKFALQGKHGKLACESCHRGNVRTEKLSTDCVACHRADDVHKGQQGDQCQRCHNPAGWTRQVAFDHDLTAFPLVGLHATLPCESCHLSSAYKQAPTACIDCHKGDDRHKGGLGRACGSCHNPSGWDYWNFDHAKQTQFALTGAHANLVCVACHDRPTDDARIAGDCYSCHAKDDRHDGRFGRDCDRCHTTVRFDDIRMPGG